MTDTQIVGGDSENGWRRAYNGSKKLKKPLHDGYLKGLFQSKTSLGENIIFNTRSHFRKAGGVRKFRFPFGIVERLTE
jgi:hypothetical protein